MACKFYLYRYARGWHVKTAGTTEAFPTKKMFKIVLISINETQKDARLSYTFSHSE